MLRDDGDELIADERRPSRNGFIKHYPERVEIASWFGLVSEHQLGWHIDYSADKSTLQGDPRKICAGREPEISKFSRAVLSSQTLPGFKSR